MMIKLIPNISLTVIWTYSWLRLNNYISVSKLARRYLHNFVIPCNDKTYALHVEQRSAHSHNKLEQSESLFYLLSFIHPILR